MAASSLVDIARRTSAPRRVDNGSKEWWYGRPARRCGRRRTHQQALIWRRRRRQKSRTSGGPEKRAQKLLPASLGDSFACRAIDQRALSTTSIPKASPLALRFIAWLTFSAAHCPAAAAHASLETSKTLLHNCLNVPTASFFPSPVIFFAHPSLLPALPLLCTPYRF